MNSLEWRSNILVPCATIRAIVIPVYTRTPIKVKFLLPFFVSYCSFWLIARYTLSCTDCNSRMLRNKCPSNSCRLVRRLLWSFTDLRNKFVCASIPKPFTKVDVAVFVLTLIQFKKLKNCKLTSNAFVLIHSLLDKSRPSLFVRTLYRDGE